MKILIAGAGGQLGCEMVEMFKQKGNILGKLSSAFNECEIVGLDENVLDITDLNSVKKTIKEHEPDVVINCAAMTDVDGCENNLELAFKVNALGARNLAMASEMVDAKFVQISTDYVFDGTKDSPRVEFDSINPVTAYGRTKALGEKFAQQFCRKSFVVRTAWLYGAHGKNFVKTIVKIAKAKGKLKVVADQFGNPTNVSDLAFCVSKIIETEEYGIYHCSGNGIASWFNFADEIVKQFKIDAIVEPCLTIENPRPASRPKFSCLDNLMLRITVKDHCRDWRKALEEFVKQNPNLE